MFAKQVECAPFGVLHGQGRSKVWETELVITELGGRFFVRVHDLVSGPAPGQSEAMACLLHNAARIRASASAELAEFLNSSDIPPDGMWLDAETVWQHLTPEFIEVSPEGSHGAGQYSIAVGYAIPWDRDHLVHIHTLDGRYDSVHAE